MLQKVVEELREYCNCLDVFETENMGKLQQAEMMLMDLIRYISILTCWASGEMPYAASKCGNNICDTFLLSTRQEIYKPDINSSCTCDDGLMTVRPRYKLIQPDSFQVDVQYREGIKFARVPLPDSCWSFNELEGILYLDLSGFTSDVCSCEELQYVIVTYNAGYECIPECLLQLFCELMQHVVDLNQCCDANCGCESEDQSSQEEDKAGIHQYARDLISNAYMRQIESMSLCDSGPEWYGDVV